MRIRGEKEAKEDRSNESEGTCKTLPIASGRNTARGYVVERKKTLQEYGKSEACEEQVTEGA